MIQTHEIAEITKIMQDMLNTYLTQDTWEHEGNNANNKGTQLKSRTYIKQIKD